MRRKTCVVTGTTSGIGYKLARILAGRGVVVIGVGRNPMRCAEAAARIHTKTGNQGVRFELAGLSSQAELRALAGRIRDRNDQIDVLVNNAGCFAFRRRETVDGIEMQFALYYLAGYLLTRLLLPTMTAAGSSGGTRVIIVSSGSHYSGRMHWADMGLRRVYNGLAAYDQTKLASVLFTRELARRLGPGSAVGVYAVDPGLVKTDIGMKGTRSLVRFVWRLRTRGGISPAESAATVAYLALDPLVRGRTGIYWKKCKPVAPSRRALDREDARRLWDLSAILCGPPRVSREPHRDSGHRDHDRRGPRAGDDPGERPPIRRSCGPSCTSAVIACDSRSHARLRSCSSAFRTSHLFGELQVSPASSSSYSAQRPVR